MVKRKCIRCGKEFEMSVHSEAFLTDCKICAACSLELKEKTKSVNKL